MCRVARKKLVRKSAARTSAYARVAVEFAGERNSRPLTFIERLVVDWEREWSVADEYTGKANVV